MSLYERENRKLETSAKGKRHKGQKKRTERGEAQPGGRALENVEIKVRYR
jgi:hypothetical protein